MKISMWVFAMLLVLVMGFVLMSAEAQAQTGGCSTTHIVQRGENLYRIALRYNTSVADIQARNAISNPNRIYTGQQLCVSGGFVPPITPVPHDPNVHAGRGTVTAWFLNFRSGPSTNYSVLRILRNGETFPVYGRNANGTWYKIEAGSVAGWVHASYFNVVNPQSLPVVDGGVAQPYSGNFVLLRDASLHITPNGNQGINPQTVFAGMTVRVVGRNAASTWFEIRTDDGNRWVSRDVFPAEFPRDLFPVTG